VGDQKGFFGVIEQVRISAAVRYEGDFKPEDILSNDDTVEVLLNLNVGVGTIGHDSSGKNNHATIVGAE
jgi:hypothetical protein